MRVLIMLGVLLTLGCGSAAAPEVDPPRQRPIGSTPTGSMLPARRLRRPWHTVLRWPQLVLMPTTAVLKPIRQGVTWNCK